MTGLYVHIPFCAKKCHYCNFVVTTANTSVNHDAFLGALEKQMIFAGDFFQTSELDTLYLGGGTPSVMSKEETITLFDLIKRHFRIKNGAEITCEINPESLDLEKAENYRRMGANRISLGAQSFRDETLKRLNRPHAAKDIANSFQLSRKVGFDNISLDLILSLPGETLDDVKNSLNRLLELGPDHVSLYELTIEPKTVFGSLSKKGKWAFPDEDLQVEMLLLGRTTLKKAGFRHYELLNYAKPGFESRHNRIYWDNQEYLGLGPGAFSYIKGQRFMFAASYLDYLQKIEKGDWSNSEEETLDAEKKEVESFLLALRTYEGADTGRFHSLMERMEENIQNLEAKELLASTGGRIRLTNRGQLFAETVFAELSSLTGR